MTHAIEGALQAAAPFCVLRESRRGYSGKPTFLRRAFTRGSPRSSAYSGNVSVLPMRIGPQDAARSRAAKVRPLSPNTAKINAWLNGFLRILPPAGSSIGMAETHREPDYRLGGPDSRPFRDLDCFADPPGLIGPCPDTNSCQGRPPAASRRSAASSYLPAEVSA